MEAGKDGDTIETDDAERRALGADRAVVRGQGRRPEALREGQPALRGGGVVDRAHGAPWWDLLPRFGKWNTVFRRFRRWTEKGVFQRMFEELSSDLDFHEVQIDGTKRHESLAAEELLSGVEIETGAVLADRGFDGDALRDSIAERARSR